MERQGRIAAADPVTWAGRIARALGVFVLAYALLCAVMFVLQRRLQYLPDTSPMNPAAAGLASVTQQTLATPDGERIVVWWSPPAGEREPVYLYLHGNGANLHARAERLGALVRSGAGLMAVSWRGYGGSSGTPTEAGLLADARTAYAELRQRTPRQPVVLFGESLGTTVAVMLAAEVDAAALVLDSSFDSAQALAQRTYPWLPVPWLLRDTFRADLAAPRVRVPVFQVHCRDDPISPIEHAIALRRLLASAAPMAVVERRCHVPSLLDFRPAMEAFVAQTLR